MKRDVMQAAGLEIFAEVAIIIFFLTFAVVAARTLLAKGQSYDHVSHLPLDEGTEVGR